MCPDVFELRTDGFLYILNENPPTELHESVIAAEEICPTGAITIEQQFARGFLFSPKYGMGRQ